jgi:hypothetical protein
MVDGETGRDAVVPRIFPELEHYTSRSLRTEHNTPVRSFEAQTLDFAKWIPCLHWMKTETTALARCPD